MTNAKSIQTVKQENKWNKEIKTALINLALAGISVFLFDYWFGLVSDLPMIPMIENFGVVVLGTATLFVGKTFYGKGTVNNLMKIIYTVGLAILTVSLMLYTGLTLSIMYPLSGAILTFITFYMLSLSANTLNLVGMVAMAMVIGTGIAWMKIQDYILWDTTGTLAKWGVFLILFTGGVFPHLRRYAHGITGVNKDGGGFGSSGDTEGDDGDGDGDTGEE